MSHIFVSWHMEMYSLSLLSLAVAGVVLMHMDRGWFRRFLQRLLWLYFIAPLMPEQYFAQLERRLYGASVLRSKSNVHKLCHLAHEFIEQRGIPQLPIGNCDNGNSFFGL